MNSGKNILRFLIYLGVVFFQLIMTQVTTLLFSFIIPGMENFPQTNPALFSIILGIAFTAGVFLAGWLSIKLGWLVAKPNYPLRLVATLIGAYLPLIFALVLYDTLDPGNPFFFISMLTSILGFHIPGWIESR